MLEQHDKAVLQFSGGKDSLACLYLLRAHWDKIIVLWVNTGAAYPETLQQMHQIREMVPRFEEVRSDQPTSLKEFGYPVDVLPIRNSSTGQLVHPGAQPRLQNYLACCMANIWRPMDAAVRQSGATLVIRGQRNQEARRAPIKNGTTVDGITYWFPLQDWSAQDVDEFLAEHGVPVPANYAWMDTSLDCWSCTAYLDENLGRMRHMQKKHPALWAEYRQRLEQISNATHEGLAHLDAALEAA